MRGSHGFSRLPENDNAKGRTMQYCLLILMQLFIGAKSPYHQDSNGFLTSSNPTNLLRGTLKPGWRILAYFGDSGYQKTILQ